jgi:hypothetical protein
MPALVAGIHVFKAVPHQKAWMAETSPAMTMWMGHRQRPLVLGFPVRLPPLPLSVMIPCDFYTWHTPRGSKKSSPPWFCGPDARHRESAAYRRLAPTFADDRSRSRSNRRIVDPGHDWERQFERRSQWLNCRAPGGCPEHWSMLRPFGERARAITYRTLTNAPHTAASAAATRT